MELAQYKTSFKEFASHKATRIMSYITLAVFAVIIFSTVNQSSAITEASLKLASGTGADKSGTVMNTPVLWVINFLKGTGGLFATVLAFVMTLYAAVIAKSLMGIVIAVGIGIAAVFGPAILMSIFGAAI
ncbi:hypothetical protein [Acinetobacter ursingii]|uniref:hypothetical protein n=1 Tax=Acinetobacter ursingii TaxID=108980 RepID=UPI002E1828EE|nr:hypothetical protein [Acinetobacter ursingii]